jgi:hypothetical protein
MIASATEIFLRNLLLIEIRTFCSPFCHNVPVEYFASAAAFCRSPEQYWHEILAITPWDVILLCLAGYIDKWRCIIKKTFKLIDESMSRWHPKATKLGGLPRSALASQK